MLQFDGVFYYFFSKGICEAQNEFEGSYERVEFERLLIEAHHKHKYASDEIDRLKNMMARGQLDAFKGM